MTTDITSFSPTLTDFLYSGNNVPQVVTLYSNALQKYADTIGDKNQSSLLRLHAGKLIDYRDNYIMDKDYVSFLRKKIFNTIYDMIVEEEPNLPFRIEGRIKSLTSTEQKILHYKSQNKSLDLLRDLIAFRIIILGENSKELVLKCYSLLEKITNFCVSKGFIPCESDDLVGTVGFSHNILPEGVIIPNESEIPITWRNSTKDYILNPKKNGYQSLHIVFKTATEGKFFEIQIRTFAMHSLESSNHEDYKKNSLGLNRVDFDPSRISMKNFSVSKSGKILDYAGLTSSLIIFHRQNTLY